MTHALPAPLPHTPLLPLPPRAGYAKTGKGLHIPQRGDIIKGMAQKDKGCSQVAWRKLTEEERRPFLEKARKELEKLEKARKLE